MKSGVHISMLTATLLLFSGSPAMTAQAKSSAQRGGQAKSHMSIEGQENTNAQWSADAQKGKDRAAERHQLHKTGPKANHAEKGFNKSATVPNGKAKGFFGVR